MEQVKDFRLTSTPQILIVIASVLLVLRIGLTVAELMHPVDRGRAVAWSDAAKVDFAADTSKKYKILEFYAAWCSPCERLERDVMTNAEIRSEMENKFDCIRVVDRQREDGKNSQLVAALQKKYRVFAFPTLVAVGRDNEPVGMLVGNSNSLAVYRFLTRIENFEQFAKPVTNTK